MLPVSCTILPIAAVIVRLVIHWGRGRARPRERVDQPPLGRGRDPHGPAQRFGPPRAEGHRAHRHFRAVTSMTPIQIQKQIRPHEARARLLAEPGDVTDAGFAVGYDSASQFSREYPCVFGVPPSRDALALRKAAVLP